MLKCSYLDLGNYNVKWTDVLQNASECIQNGNTYSCLCVCIGHVCSLLYERWSFLCSDNLRSALRWMCNDTKKRFISQMQSLLRKKWKYRRDFGNILTGDIEPYEQTDRSRRYALYGHSDKACFPANNMLQLGGFPARVTSHTGHFFYHSALRFVTSTQKQQSLEESAALRSYIFFSFHIIDIFKEVTYCIMEQ